MNLFMIPSIYFLFISPFLYLKSYPIHSALHSKNSFMHSFMHASTHPFTHPFIHSVINSRSHSCIHPHIHASIQQHIKPSTYVHRSKMVYKELIKGKKKIIVFPEDVVYVKNVSNSTEETRVEFILLKIIFTKYF